MRGGGKESPISLGAPTDDQVTQGDPESPSHNQRYLNHQKLAYFVLKWEEPQTSIAIVENGAGCEDRARTHFNWLQEYCIAFNSTIAEWLIQRDQERQWNKVVMVDAFSSSFVPHQAKVRFILQLPIDTTLRKLKKVWAT